MILEKRWSRTNGYPSWKQPEYALSDGSVLKEWWLLYSPTAGRFWGTRRDCQPLSMARRWACGRDAASMAAEENHRVAKSLERGHPLEGHFGDWMQIRVVE